MASTHRVCGMSAAPKNDRGSLPENAGRAKVSLPQSSMAPPRMRMLTPMVMMTRLMAGQSRTGRMARRSTSAPSSVVPATARTMASGSGRPRARMQNTLIMPPSITNSPWAKLMMPVAL